MDDRRTIRSGLPTELKRELQDFVGALVPVGDGRLRFERILGHGGLFVTFAATRIHRRGALPVAVKLLRPSIARAWPAGPRVLSSEQAQLMALLNERLPPSPHVVRLLEAGELGPDEARGLDLTVPFFALELVAPALDLPDASLFTRVRMDVTTQGYALDGATALGVLRGVARGLDHVHEHGLVHRALGPTNVLLAGTVACVTDVAVASPTGLPENFGVFTDTPAHSKDAYRAPEQRAGAPVGPAFDVYAFASLARFVLTGRPDRALGGCDTIHPSLRDLALARDVEALDACVEEGLSVDPERRPATIASFFAALEPHLAALAKTTPKRPAPSASPPASGWVWSVRHEPPTPLVGVSRALMDDEGRALLIGCDPTVFFDGRAHRPLALANLATRTAVAHDDGRWAVLGRSPEGFGTGVELAAGVQRLLGRHRSAAITAAFLRGRLAFIDGESRLFVDDRQVAALEGLSFAYAMGTIDDEMAAVVGMGAAGAPYLATVDLGSFEVRTQPWPVRALGFSMARDRRGEGLVIGCAHGVVVDLQRTASRRVVTTPTQLPNSADVLAVASDPSGVVLAGAGSALYVRPPRGEFTLAHEDGHIDIVALAPRPRGCLLLGRSGLVLEGRALLPRT